MSARWEAHGFNPDQAFERTLLGLTPELAARWATYDLPFEEIEEWVSNGFIDPVDASEWLTSGYGADEAADLESQGYSPEQASIREENERQDDASEWEEDW